MEWCGVRQCRKSSSSPNHQVKQERARKKATQGWLLNDWQIVEIDSADTLFANE